MGNPQYVWEEFKEPYHWMMEQMKKQLHYSNGDYPIWVWTKKPDLRCGGHFEKGNHAVRLEVDLPDQEVLISDFDAWHCVLNDSFKGVLKGRPDKYIYSTQVFDGCSI